MTRAGKRLLANFLAADDSTMPEPVEMATSERGK
jgi:hypothetical protein